MEKLRNKMEILVAHKHIFLKEELRVIANISKMLGSSLGVAEGNMKLDVFEKSMFKLDVEYITKFHFMFSDETMEERFIEEFQIFLSKRGHSLCIKF